MKHTKYQIRKDHYLGYEVRVWDWWLPFWREMNFSNTHSSIEEAKNYIKSGGGVLWEGSRDDIEQEETK